MTYHVTTIYPDGRTGAADIADAAKVQDAAKLALKGGWLELVPHFASYGGRECIAYCGEDAKANGLPINPKATYLWYACLAPEPFIPDQLRGPVVIVCWDTAKERSAL